MEPQCLPFRDVPGTSRVFLDFLGQSPKIRSFYPTSTLSLDDLADRARNLQIPSDRRQRVADALARQSRQWNAGPEALANIERLRQGACAVVTGQQVGLFLGPAYTVFKALTALRLARELTNRGVDAVPIFWLASEDHDLAEVNHAFLPDAAGGLQRLQTSSRGDEDAPVGKVILSEDVSSLVEQLAGFIDDSTLDAVRASYRPGQTLAGAFADLMARLFSTHGLIILEPSDPELHRIGTSILQSAAANAELLTRILLDRNKELESAGYHSQVKVTGSSTLLFFLKDGARVPIHRKNTHFTVNGEHWTPEQLQQQIAANPELFTANVLLRPVLQDYLLPTSVYITGPAETAYFAQAQVVYERLLGRATPIWPRFSATLVEARLASWMRKYGLTLRDVLQPKDDFRAKLARRTIPADLKDDFDRSREQLEKLLAPLMHSLKRLDPTVASAGEIAARKMRYQLERLESRAARAHLRHEQVLERHANLLSSMLFPEKELQERHIAGIYFLGKYGPELIDRLLDEYKPDCHDHQIISLM